MYDLRLTPALIPQADDLERVLAYARASREDGPTPAEAGFGGRDAHYYAHASRVLGLVDAHGSLTSAGRSALEAPDPVAALVERFEVSAVAKAWAAWAGEASVWNVPNGSAREFLVASGALSESTAERRAATLRSWHAALGPLAAARPTPEAVRDALLARPLDHLQLPTRLTNWARRMDVTTVREVVAFGRAGLLEQRNLGRTSVSAFNRILMAHGTGEGLDELHRVVTGSGPSAAQPSSAEPAGVAAKREPRSWDQLARWIPEAIAAQPVSRAHLPTRLANFCGRRGIETLGSLVAMRASELLDEKNLGRSSIVGGLAAVLELARRIEAIEGAGEDSSPTVELDRFPTYEAVWHSMLSTLSFQARLILSRRSGVAAEAKTLGEIGELLGVTRERVRQLEKSALERLHHDLLTEALATRLDTALAGRAAALEDVGEDAFWAPALGAPDRFRYLVERVLPGERRLVPWDGGWVVSPSPVDDADRAFAVFLALASERFPIALVELESEAHAAGEQEGPGFGELFVERLHEELILDRAETTVLGHGSSRIERIRAFLLDRKAPVRVGELAERFGRGLLPEDIVYVEHGLATLPENIEGFALWQARLVPLCLRVMEERGPELQWMTADLLEALPELAQVPAFVTPHVLAGMLRRSKAFDDLGRMRFALPGTATEGRIQFVPTLVRVLDEAGEPLRRGVLRERLAAVTTFRDLTFALCLVRLPLLPVDAERVGLVDRDVPGGRAALERACELVEAELEERGRGLSFTQARAWLASVSDEYAPWTPEIVAAAARLSSELMSNRAGIGLSSWESVRVPTRSELLRQLVDEGEGEARVEDVIARYEEQGFESPKRGALSALAWKLNLKLDGDRIVDRALVKSLPPPPAPETRAGTEAVSAPALVSAVLPALEALGIPREARGLFATLLDEPIGSWDRVLASCAEHVSEIEARHRLNEFLALDDARALLAALRSLVDRVRASNDTVAQRLAWAVVRYFQITDDAETDFTIGGLDDDLAVFNAVALHLGRADLRLEPSA